RAQASGDLITRLVDGIEAILAYFARYLPQLGTAVLVPVLLAAFVFPADWLSGLVLLLTAPLIPLFMTLVGKAAGQASEHRFSQLTRLGAAFIEALGGLVTLRLLGAADRFADRLESEGEEYRALTMQVLRIAFLSALVLEFFATVSIAVVAVLIGFRLLWGGMHLRTGLFVLLLAP
ncbi:ABC transporter, CydDC cysteine exporter (CydDC-E) family, permease/ATP-binding protein CydD, partial [mine drainage metagenome]